MRYDAFIRQKLGELFGSHMEDLQWEFVVEPQEIIKLTATRVLETSEWKMITEDVEAMGGCWEHVEGVWKIPRFLGRMNLPACDKTFNPRRLHIRSLTLRNLVFLHDTFKGKPPKSWKDIQSALCYFASNNRTKRKYSKAACRDYLGALLALAP